MTAAEGVSVEEHVHLRQPPPRRPVLGEDDCRHDGGEAPSESPSLLWGEPRLGVEAAEQLLHIDQGSLYLDHEQDTGSGMPRKQVDAAALAIAAVADFDLDHPSPSFEPALDRRADPGVAGVEQPIELRTVPEDTKIDPATERSDNRLDHADR